MKPGKGDARSTKMRIYEKSETDRQTERERERERK
jgi:hypothetical protein